MLLKADELSYNFISEFCNFEKDLVLTNHFHSDWEADILIINAEGCSHEIEIKLSKSDFKNDFRKKYYNQATNESFLKHDKLSAGDYLCNQFSFLLPMGMIAHESIPEHCGIIEFYHNPDRWITEFHQIRKPKQVHNKSFWELVDKDLMMRMLARNFWYKKLELKGRSEELILPPNFGKKK